jgi:hypothetical protein
MPPSEERIPVLIIKVSKQEEMEPAVVFIGTGLREDYLRESFQSKQDVPAFHLF